MQLKHLQMLGEDKTECALRISVENLKETHLKEVVFSWLKFSVINWCEEEKMQRNIE